MRRPSALLAALLLGSAAGVAVATGPAAAAACPAGQGVTVVVGSSVSCDANGGGSAADNFADAGYTLKRVDRQPGFVCQINGEPASASCVNTPPSNAYWGLFWSDGTSGTWKYASQGAYSLSVPAGGWVGFAFQNSDSRTPPGVAPTGAAVPAAKPVAKPSPKPSAKPKPKPTAKAEARPTTAPTTTPTAKAAAPSASTGTPTPVPGASASPTPSAATPSPPAVSDQPQAASTPDVAESANTPSAADDGESGGSGSLPLVAGVLVVALMGGMGVAMWRRKAAGGSS